MREINLAINGFGRIGRNVLRAVYEHGYRQKGIRVVAINDLGDARINAHLLQYDTTHGRFGCSVGVEGDCLTVDGEPIRCYSEKDPARLPWQSLGVEVVHECTGVFRDQAGAGKHLEAGASKVIISAPAKDPDATIVYGVNDSILTSAHRIISCASCTTNCLAPVAAVLHDAVGIDSGLMTTIHAYTNDQRLTDVYHSDLYRARAAALNMIPTKTGAAEAVGLVLPDLAGKINGLAVRVPTINVSLVDFCFVASRTTTVEEVNDAVRSGSQKNPVLAVNDESLVSMDFNHNPASSVFDASLTKVQGQQVKVMAWYDNEWAFSVRMLDNTLALINAA
ncbi:MAG: type I glyceraldehyde-3-phosphate dehydrogenase [Oceanospirillales bacterium LUC14_002_19_P2]|nr:MAG: type I glyceraldehyde-3-phosphate dehydrogenase [Oceanospirillales bacterium LUC14_002_19_P2]